jgi:hypothetical protein
MPRSTNTFTQRLKPWIAIRASPHGGNDWADVRTTDMTRDGCARRAQYLDSGDPAWAAQNPVVRITNDVTLTVAV